MELGGSVSFCCRKLGIGNSTVDYWRKHDKEFLDNYNRILQSPTHRDRILQAKSWTETPPELDWRDKFFRYYSEHKNRTRAAEYCGKKPSEILEHLDPNSDEYDEKFASRWREENIRLSWEIDDDFKAQAAQGNVTAQKFLLPKLVPEYKEEGGKATGGANVFIFNSDGFRQAISTLNEVLSQHENVIELETNEDFVAEGFGGVLTSGEEDQQSSGPASNPFGEIFSEE